MKRPTDEQIRQAEEAAAPSSRVYWLTLALTFVATIAVSLDRPWAWFAGWLP